MGGMTWKESEGNTGVLIKLIQTSSFLLLLFFFYLLEVDV